MTNLALGSAAFLIAGLYAFGILQIPLLGFGDPLGPRLLPSILTAALTVIGICLLIEGRNLKTLRADYARFSSYIGQTDFRIVASVALWTGFYFAAFSPIGYLLSTTAFLLGLILVFHRGSRIVGATVAVLFAAGSYFLFSGLFGVPLPRGILPL